MSSINIYIVAIIFMMQISARHFCQKKIPFGGQFVKFIFLYRWIRDESSSSKVLLKDIQCGIEMSDWVVFGTTLQSAGLKQYSEGKNEQTL